MYIGGSGRSRKGLSLSSRPSKNIKFEFILPREETGSDKKISRGNFRFSRGKHFVYWTSTEKA